MLLIKRMSAWDFLVDLNEDSAIHPKIGNLYEDILDNNLCGALDNMVNYEFPSGTDEDEITEFFINEQDYIRKELGIEKDDV